MNKPADLKLATVPAWINGKPVVPQGRMGDIYNPATGRVTKQVPYCDAATIDAAVKAAAETFLLFRAPSRTVSYRTSTIRCRCSRSTFSGST